MPVVDGGAPTGGRGIEQLTTPKLITSDNFHVDAVPLGGKNPRCKVDVQRKKGTKNTVACAILAMSVSSDTDVRLALTSSLGNQHIWNVT